MLLPYEGMQAAQKHSLPDSFFEGYGASSCCEPGEAVMVHLCFFKKHLCGGAFVAVLYLFVRVNSTVCSTSRVKACK